MAEAPKPPTEMERLYAENVALRMRVSGLEADVRARDAEIAHLRKFKPSARDKGATDAFQRPI